MKAKIKLELTNNYGCQRTRNLVMILILNSGFLSSYHRKVIIDGDRFEYVSNRDRFYDEVYNFITNKDQIIVKGKKFMKDILKDKLKENKIEYIEKLIKNMKPIEIEVKDEV